MMKRERERVDASSRENCLTMKLYRRFLRYLREKSPLCRRHYELHFNGRAVEP